MNSKSTPNQTAIISHTLKSLSSKHKTESKAVLKTRIELCAKTWDFKRAPGHEFSDFCLEQYVSNPRDRLSLLKRLDEIIYNLYGMFGMFSKLTRHAADVADVEFTAAEKLFSAFSASTHVLEDLRTFKLAALVQLNFGTNDTEAPKTRAAWAERRISNIGREVFPAPILAQASSVSSEVQMFIDNFNLALDRIDFGDSAVKFPSGTFKVSHWGLRDYMTSLVGAKDGLRKQQAIREIMRRVVDGQIPQEFINSTQVQWNLTKDSISIQGKHRKPTWSGAVRWENFKKSFDCFKQLDPYRRYGNIIDSKFLGEREIPEQRIVTILKQVLSSPVALGVGKYIAQKIGRPLEAHDIYFKNFLGKTDLPKLPYDLGKRYSNAAALTAAIPSILEKLGFSKQRAAYLGSKIRVDNSRCAGHAASPYTINDLQLLRVRVDKKGINEQEFATFMHELGHCVEGVMTSYEMDYKALWGVPNTAFTEAFAFTFQDKSDFVLGRRAQPSAKDRAIETLLRFWEVYEIAGPALVEIELFHWLYANPRAKAIDIHKKIREIGDSVWKRYYARTLGPEGYGLMSIYSHIISCSFYLADYPMGYVIAYQVRKHLRDKELASEMERMCKVGCIYPDQWMRNAVGAAVSVKPLLDDAQAALKELGY